MLLKSDTIGACSSWAYMCPVTIIKRNLYINMKLHLPIALLTLAVSSVAYAGGTYRPADVVIVQDKSTLTVNATENADVLDRLQAGAYTNSTNSTPMAFTKDGSGTLVLAADATMNNTLMVREGTMKIQNATVVNNSQLSDGVCNLVVAGKGAVLELDNAHYSQSIASENKNNSTSAIAIGSDDGAGTVKLNNKSTLHTDHCLFVGRVNGTYEGKPAYVQPSYAGKEGEGLYTEGDKGAASYISIEGASKMSAGTQIYLDDVTVDVKGKGSALVAATRGINETPFHIYDSVMGSRTGGTTEVNVSEGAELTFYRGLQTGTKESTVTVNVKGEGSSFNMHGDAWLGLGSYDYSAKDYKANGSTTQVNITGGATLNVGGAFDVGYASAANLTVDADSSVKAMEGSDSAVLYVEKNGSVNARGSVDIDVTVDGGTYMGGDTFGAASNWMGSTLYQGNEFSVLNNGRVSDVRFDNCTINLEDVAILHNVTLGCLPFEFPGFEDIEGSVTLNILEGTEIHFSGYYSFGEDLNIQVVVDENGYNKGDTLFSIIVDGATSAPDLGEDVNVTLVDAAGKVLGSSTLNKGGEPGNYQFSTNVTVIPEPATATLSLLALAALAARRRRASR